jgi:hypothetical protein
MLQYLKNKYDTYFNNSIEQLTIANNNLKYNENVWQYYIDIFNNIIGCMLDDLDTVYALYRTSKIFHNSIHNITKIIFNGNKFDFNKFYNDDSNIPISLPPYNNNVRIISLQNFVIKLPQIPFIENKSLELLYNSINYWDCEQLELISCHFDWDNCNTINPLNGLGDNKTIKKIYFNNITGLNHGWIMCYIFVDIKIDEIAIYNSPHKEGENAVVNMIITQDVSENTMETFCTLLSTYDEIENPPCKINKISVVHCDIVEVSFYTLMKVFSKTNISTIDLSHNLIRKDCNNFICDCLRTFTNLKTLNLTGNPIDIEQINIWRGSNSMVDILF